MLNMGFDVFCYSFKIIQQRNEEPNEKTRLFSCIPIKCSHKYKDKLFGT